MKSCHAKRNFKRSISDSDFLSRLLVIHFRQARNLGPSLRWNLKTLQRLKSPDDMLVHAKNIWKLTKSSNCECVKASVKTIMRAAECYRRNGGLDREKEYCEKKKLVDHRSITSPRYAALVHCIIPSTDLMCALENLLFHTLYYRCDLSSVSSSAAAAEVQVITF